jgi:predicted dehydrogenase
MGVIGVGGISGKHISGIIGSPDAELVAICDINPDTLKRKGDACGIPDEYRFLNHLELLKCPEVDAVSICTPNNAHYPIAKDAIRFKKPFALEKPVTMTYGEAKQLRQTAEADGIPNMVCFSYRFIPAARYARALIRQGHLGKIYHIYASYLQGWGINEQCPLVWRFKRDITGTGALGDLGSHMIDLVRFLCGDITGVFGYGQTFVDKRPLPGETDKFGTVDVDDCCHFIAQMSGGVAAGFNISRYAYGRGNYQRVEVYGSKGGLVYHLEHSDSLEVCIGDVYGGAADYHEIKIPQSFKADQMQSFFDVINGKGDGLTADISDGCANQLVLDSIEKSMKENKWINI